MVPVRNRPKTLAGSARPGMEGNPLAGGGFFNSFFQSRCSVHKDRLISLCFSVGSTRLNAIAFFLKLLMREYCVPLDSNSS